MSNWCAICIVQFVPLFTTKWVLALHGWEVFSDTSAGSLVPFYLMPSLGGKNTLRGYADYRFHDRDMQVFNAESRWALWANLDVAAFAARLERIGLVEALADGIAGTGAK